jgi:hypothetical protein
MSAPALRRVALFAAVFFAAATPSRAADVTLNNLNYELGSARILIPRIEVRGTSLSEAELRAILDQSAAGDPVARLERFTARSIVIPQASVQTTDRPASQSSVYRNITLTDVTAGVVGSMRIEAITGTASDASQAAISYSVGETLAEGIDMTLVARVLTSSVPDPEAVPLRPISRSFSYKNYVMKLGDKNEVSIARVAGRDSMARPGKVPLLQAIRAVTEVSEKQKAAGGKSGNDPADMMKIAPIFAFMSNFEYGVIDAEDIRGSFQTEKDQLKLAVARVRFSDQQQNPGFALSNMTLSGREMKFALAEFLVRDFSFRQTFRAAAEMMEKGTANPSPADLLRLVPKLGSIRFNGVEIEAPETARPGRSGPPETFRASLKSFELGFPAQRDGIPTAFRFSVDELAAALPRNSTEQSVRDLTALGIRDVNLSSLLELGWQEASRIFDVKALNLSGKGLGSASISAQLGNVGPEAFSTDTALAQVAWLSATAQRLRLSLDNAGLFELLVANEARKSRKTPEALRREWGTLAAIGLPAILGDSDGAKALSGAISRFIAKPGKLDIDLKSRSPNGIGVADAVAVMAAPQAIFERIEVQASAQ